MNLWIIVAKYVASICVPCSLHSLCWNALSLESWLLGLLYGCGLLKSVLCKFDFVRV